MLNYQSFLAEVEAEWVKQPTSASVSLEGSKLVAKDDWHILAGGGQVGVLLRGTEWKVSPLGPTSAWSQPLKTLLGVVMGSNQPMFVA